MWTITEIKESLSKSIKLWVKVCSVFSIKSVDEFHIPKEIYWTVEKTSKVVLASKHEVTQLMGKSPVEAINDN